MNFMLARLCLFSVIILSSLFFTCKEKSTGVSVKQLFPIINQYGKLLGYDTSTVLIYYHDNLVVYKLGYQFDSSSGNRLIFSEKRVHYFIYQKNDSFGFDYDEHKGNVPVRYSIDSIFKKEWIKQNKLYPIFSDNNVELLSSEKRNGLLLEINRIKDKKDPLKAATAYAEYSGDFSDIDYSLSRELDSIKGMKLSRLRIVYDARPLNDSIKIDPFETYVELSRLRENEIKDLNMCFSRFNYK